MQYQLTEEFSMARHHEKYYTCVENEVTISVVLSTHRKCNFDTLYDTLYSADLHLHHLNID